MKDKFSIPKNYLMLIAGVVWLAAGTMVTVLGLPLLINLSGNIWLSVLAVIVFLAFYLLIFSKLVKKHTIRIRENPRECMPFWQFFDKPSYIIMIIMMSGGITLRSAHIIPDWVIAFFYTGLGIALFSCGTRFISVFFRKKVLK
ncbi:MAG: hypothetical protein PHQ49_02255 [Clostridia bacterium]|nr:hypothetical protein [Clostridia bacterium]